jgi:hypothetical protein
MASSSRIGSWVSVSRRLRFPATCEVCGAPVGQAMVPFYLLAPRGQRARYRCYRDRHGRRTEVSSTLAPPVSAVAPGSRWTDGDLTSELPSSGGSAATPRLLPRVSSSSGD